jgi:dienelactone hydrolase
MTPRGARRIPAVGAIAGCLLLVGSTVAEAQRLWGDLEPGPYPVGYRTVRVYDGSRTFGPGPIAARLGPPAQSRRLMSVRVWYPAAPNAAGRMALGEYLDLRVVDGPVTPTVRERIELDLDGMWSDLCTCRTPRDAADRRLQALRDTPTASLRDAAPASGRHPVVVYSLGHDMHALENVVLWEFLASHGYLVAVTPSVGHRAVPMEPVGATSAEVKTRDLEFVMQWLGGIPFADLDRVAAGGFSLGGWSALMLAFRNGDIDAIVALDGSFNLPNRVAAVQAMPFFRPSIFALPLLNLRQDEPESDLSILESLTNSERYDTKIGDLDPPNASHHSFTSIYTFSVEFYPSSGDRDELAGLSYNRAVFQLVAERVRVFLDAFLKRDAGARAALQQPPREPGVPDGMVGHRYLAAAPRP